jgi:hypothetical protein
MPALGGTFTLRDGTVPQPAAPKDRRIIKTPRPNNLKVISKPLDSMHLHFGKVDIDVVIPIVKILNRGKDDNGEQGPHHEGIEASAALLACAFSHAAYFSHFLKSYSAKQPLNDQPEKEDATDDHHH